MSTNTELARIFDEMSKVLELTGANSFRVSAHARVARELNDLATDVSELADDPKKLTAVEGIGAGSAKKIIEYVNTGKVSEHDELLEKIPRGLLEVLDIPGLGPKTVKLLWESAGVEDLDSLAAKLDAGELEGLPRMGAKTVENIRASMKFRESSQQRIRLGKALPLAELIVEHLRNVKGAQQVEYAGSVRRGRETIGDIDILASSTDPETLSATFVEMPGVVQVSAAGETKSSIRLEGGVQVDLRVVDADSFGAAMMYFTGSKQHNVSLRERAIKKGLRLNEYGLFPDDGEHDEPPQRRGVKPVAAATEQDVYAALDLPWFPPEIREDRGELSLAETPDLIERSDVKCDLHAHTTASDGRMTIQELAEAAKALGYHTVAITDHSKASAQANGLEVDRLKEHIEAIRAANATIKGITLLAGSEVDILADGHLDYEDDVLAELDIVVASPHVALSQDSAAATKRLVRAISHPLVHILGHPSGRMINRREGLELEINALIEAAIEHDTALELNANPMRLDLRDAHIRAAVEAGGAGGAASSGGGALISINTDAHAPDQFDLMRYGILTARRGWLTAQSCINTWTNQKLAKWLKAKR